MKLLRGGLTASLVAAAWAMCAPAVASQPTARVSADTSGPATRVIVTLSQALGSSILTGPAKVEIVFAAPVDIAPSESRLDDAILKGWQVKGDRTLVLSVGSTYKGYESFELRNPARLVLDLRGERPQRAQAAPAPAKGGRGRPVIVLDPGHGGVETGATGPSGTEEKAVALELSRRLKISLERDAGAVVVLTRDEDRVMPLDERAAIANHNRAELFLSVHLNASKRRGAVGAETYFLSPDSTDDEARTLAALENRASGVPDAPQAGRAEGERGLDLILWDLAQNQYLAESGRLAESVQRELNASTGVRDRGVRQAPFRVLMGATMPAILVEVGFISNPQEESRLKEEAYKDKIVDALARAIREFRGRRAATDGAGAAKP